MKIKLYFSLGFVLVNQALVLANTCDHVSFLGYNTDQDICLSYPIVLKDVGYDPILDTSTYFEDSGCIADYLGMQACSCNGADIVSLQIP